MFDLDQFIADCRASLVEDATHKSVREVVARAVSDPGAVLKGVRRAATLRNTENLPLGRSHYSQCHLGTADDNLAPQPPNVGHYRHIHGPRGQYLLAAAPGWQG